MNRTWAPRGHTPRRARQASLHCRVCAAAALALAPRRRRGGLDFRLQADANLTAAEIVRYLRHLRRQLQRPLVVVWGRLGGHCGYVVQRILRHCRGVHRESLPPFAPELNLKGSRLAECAPADGWGFLRVGLSIQSGRWGVKDII